MGSLFRESVVLGKCCAVGALISCDTDSGDLGLLVGGDGVIMNCLGGAVTLMNRLFRVVTLPDPSTFILY